MENFVLGNLDTLEDDNFTPIKAGVYQVRAVSMEMKDTKSMTGKYVKVEFDVVGGEYDGRKIWELFNIVNQNSTTVEIALKQIKQWLMAAGQAATGELRLSQLFDLEGSTVAAKVGIYIDKSGQYDPKNVIKRFLSNGPAGIAPQQPAFSQQPVTIQQSAAPVQQPIPQPAAVAPPVAAATGTRPW